MPTYRKRLGKWQVQVRLAGKPAISKTFPTKELARAWAIQQERLLLSGGILPDKITNSTTLGQLFKRYRDEVTPRKKGHVAERYRLNKLIDSALAPITIGNLKPGDIASYRDSRLENVSQSTVRRELVLIRHCFAISANEWGYEVLKEIFSKITLPKEAHHRVRRISSEELEKLLSALSDQRNTEYRLIVELALETGMRRSELLNLTFNDVRNDLIEVANSKSGYPRIVPMTAHAKNIVSSIECDDMSNKLFNSSSNGLRLAWERAREKSGVFDLRFHDLRHEAISRMLEMGLSIAEVATICGHREYKSLFKYAHMEIRKISDKLH